MADQKSSAGSREEHVLDSVERVPGRSHTELLRCAYCSASAVNIVASRTSSTRAKTSWNYLLAQTMMVELAALAPSGMQLVARLENN